MELKEKLPENIRKLLGGNEFEKDSVGMSRAGVYLFPDRVLKIQPLSEESQNEYAMLRWLGDKLPVPRVLAREGREGRDFLLMERCPGGMACAERYMSQPDLLCSLLADTLKALWAVDIRDCPADWRLDHKLEAAEYNVKNGLVDVDNVEPDTFGPGGFRDPADLLGWLKSHRPAEESVLTHGDFCLSNIFGNGDRLTGLIDLGRAGAGDRWCDIALCCRDLRHTFEDIYSDRPYPDYDSLLFRALEIEPDEEKLRYYMLLDELF